MEFEIENHKDGKEERKRERKFIGRRAITKERKRASAGPSIRHGQEEEDRTRKRRLRR